LKKSSRKIRKRLRKLKKKQSEKPKRKKRPKYHLLSYLKTLQSNIQNLMRKEYQLTIKKEILSLKERERKLLKNMKSRRNCIIHG